MNIKDKTKLRLEQEVDPLLSDIDADIDADKVMAAMDHITDIWRETNHAGAWYKPWTWQPQLDAYDMIIERTSQLSILTSLWAHSVRVKDA